MHLQTGALFSFYLLTSIAASPYPLKVRPSNSSDQIPVGDLSTLCLSGGDTAACNQLNWSPKLVKFLRTSPSPGSVGSSIQSSNSTEPPSVQAEHAVKPKNKNSKVTSLDEDYETDLAKPDQGSSDGDNNDSGAMGPGSIKVGSSIRGPWDEGEREETFK